MFVIWNESGKKCFRFWIGLLLSKLRVEHVHSRLDRKTRGETDVRQGEGAR